MTDTDRPAFLSAFATMAIALREPEPDTAQLRIYFEALKGFDIALVQMAARELTQTAKWFPKTSEWRDAIQATERQQRLELSERIRRLHAVGRVLCASCDDTTWARLEAGGVEPCDCRKTRRLEVLGLRPMPDAIDVLPAAATENEPKVLAMIRGKVKAMP